MTLPRFPKVEPLQRHVAAAETAAAPLSPDFPAAAASAVKRHRIISFGTTCPQKGQVDLFGANWIIQPAPGEPHPLGRWW